MSKRTVTEIQTASDGQAYAKANTSAPRRASAADNVEMGDFEDAWEDDVEDSEEEIVDGEGKEDGGMYIIRAQLFCALSD